MKTGRSEDIKELYKMLEREPHAETRENIRNTIRIVKNESGAIKSMREALIKAHRDGDHEEIKDIHEFIKGKAQYGQ